MTRWIKKLFAQPSSKQAPKARLGLESLDRRDLPSITLSNDWVFTVTGDGSNDLVTVTRDTKNTNSIFDDTITIRRDYGISGDPAGNVYTWWNTESKTYPVFWPGTTFQVIRSVKATLGHGFNQLTNSTDLPSTATGGDDKDTFRGGSGQDIFYGRKGNDYLYGNKGNDRLYGGEGADHMYGGDHTDGLYGGYGVDILDGGFGSDRFLMTETPDAILVREARDAVLQFTNTSGWVSGPSVQYDDDEAYKGASWTQTEIERLDPALAVVHERAGGPVFLRFDGDDMVFRRCGVEVVDPTGGWRDNKHYAGWNDNDGTITLNDYTFNGGDEKIHELVLHELGHNWDDEDPVGQWGVFKSLSGWVPSLFAAFPPFLNGVLNGTYLLSGDGEWIYRSSQQEFTREYARNNPMEDFAESFMMYWMHEMGETPPMATRGYDDMDVKMTWMGIFVDTVIDNA